MVYLRLILVILKILEGFFNYKEMLVGKHQQVLLDYQVR